MRDLILLKPDATNLGFTRSHRVIMTPGEERELIEFDGGASVTGDLADMETAIQQAVAEGSDDEWAELLFVEDRTIIGVESALFYDGHRLELAVQRLPAPGIVALLREGPIPFKCSSGIRLNHSEPEANGSGILLWRSSWHIASRSGCSDRATGGSACSTGLPAQSGASTLPVLGSRSLQFTRPPGSGVRRSTT